MGIRALSGKQRKDDHIKALLKEHLNEIQSILQPQKPVPVEVRGYKGSLYHLWVPCDVIILLPFKVCHRTVKLTFELREMLMQMYRHSIVVTCEMTSTQSSECKVVLEVIFVAAMTSCFNRLHELTLKNKASNRFQCPLSLQFVFIFRCRMFRLKSISQMWLV